MTVRDYDKLIQGHIDKKDYVKIERKFIEGEANIRGFILQMSRKFLLIQKEEEFYLNGYSIIRKDQFDALRSNRFDRASKKMLKAEGIFESSYGVSKPLRLNDWRTIFEDLKKLDYHVIVECENVDAWNFFIGPIKRIGKTSVSIQYYDPTGLLDKNPTTIKYEDITLVKFDDRYINVFRKYLRTRK